MTKALLFDFDGVLVSSEIPRFKYLQGLLVKYGIGIEDTDITKALGKTTVNFLREVVVDESLVEKLVAEFKSDYLANVTDHVAPIEFTVNSIREYVGELPIAIASMSSQATIVKMTKHIGIFEKITCITGRDTIIHPKPDPEIYLKTAEILRVNPAECIVFEDTTLGVNAAISAGMRCYVVLNGLNRKVDFKSLRVSGFVATQHDIENIFQS